MKKGFTLIELLISISILGVIMAAVGTLFVTVLKNYRTESQKAAFQREVNFTIDNIGKDIKEAASVPQNYDTFALSENTLILALPAVDDANNFVYSSGVLDKDYLIYYLSGTELKRKTYASNFGTRESGEISLLKNVSGFNLNYFPGATNAGQVKVSLTVTASAGKPVTLTEERTANLRNKQ